LAKGCSFAAAITARRAAFTGSAFEPYRPKARRNPGADASRTRGARELTAGQRAGPWITLPAMVRAIRRCRLRLLHAEGTRRQDS